MNKTIAIIGQPNSGKSTLFNVLSDIQIPTSNFAGTTVKINESLINSDGDVFRLLDLPGIYSLNPTSPVEAETIDFILNNKIDLVINVINSSFIARGIELTIELAELGLPIVMALNMYDESLRLGIHIDYDKLSEELNVPVVPTMALYGKGVKKLITTCSAYLHNKDNKPNLQSYTHHIEIKIEELAALIKDNSLKLPGSERFYALKSIEFPDLVPDDILNQIGEIRTRIKEEIESSHHKECYETIAYERHHIAMKFAEKFTSFRKMRQLPLSERLDNYLLHPVGGYFFLILFFSAYFFTIFVVGNFLSGLTQEPLDYIAGLFAPLKQSSPFLWNTINGGYLGFAGIIGIVLPYFLPLVMLTSIFEDTGYISRVAFLTDELFHKIGLHGKSAVSFILGFGCSVPAIYASRIIENKRDRAIAGILIPFIPCSARIAVIFALTAAFAGPLWAVGVFALVILVIGIAGKILSKTLSQPFGLILEIPSLKKPTLKNSYFKTKNKIQDFVKDAFTFLIAGSIILGWIEYFQASHFIDLIFSPLVKNVFGLPEQLGST
ncbi:MAG: ferrous iron transport protein, partial [Bacteroidota bacterium]|nr:ferrous iron transport protein [Bacteroidota bacterium]